MRLTSVATSVSRVARAFPIVASAKPSVQQNRLIARLGAVRTFGASASPLHKVIAGISHRSGARKFGQGIGASFALFGTRGMSTELAPKEAPAGLEIATFAGGCFWGLELAFQREPGVAKTSVGYTQGQVEGPSYQAVCGGRTGHTEAVQVYYDPKEVSYERLLELFFDRTDPTTKDRQGNDAGTQYRSGIYFHNDEQKAAAEKAIAEVEQKIQNNQFRPVFGNKVVVEVEPAADYWLAENYHQQYLEKGGQDASKGASARIRCYG